MEWPYFMSADACSGCSALMMATNIKNRSVHCSMVSGCLSFGVSVTLEEGCTIDASSLICNITCLLACGAPFAIVCIRMYLNCKISAFTLLSTDDPNGIEIIGYETVLVNESPDVVAATVAAAIVSPSASASLLGDVEVDGCGSHVCSSLRRPDNTLSVTRSTMASSLAAVDAAVEVDAAVDVDAAADTAVAGLNTAPGRFPRLDGRVFGILQPQ